jgi:hypothetical protein
MSQLKTAGKVKTIKVFKDFYDELIGRFPTDSDYNGERFRNEYLVPALRDFDKVIVDFDGVEGYGSSFLDEAFGGLIHACNLSKADVLSRLSLVSDEDKSLIEEILDYINKAEYIPKD